MHPLIHKVFTARKRLIAKGQSKIDNAWVLQFMKNYEYWDAITINKTELAKKHRNKILYISPPTFVKRINRIL